MSAAKTKAEPKEEPKQPDPLERVAEAIKKHGLELAASGIAGRRFPLLEEDNQEPLYIVRAMENFKDGRLRLAVVNGDWCVLPHTTLAQAIAGGFEPDRVLNDRGDNLNWRLIFKKA